MRLDHLLSKESSSFERFSRSFGHPTGPWRWTSSWCTGYSFSRRRRRLEIQFSPASRLGLVVLCSVLRECAALAPRGDHCPIEQHHLFDVRIHIALRLGIAPASVLDQVPLENCIASTSIFVLPSYKEPTVDALASTTDEGRVWLRKATGSRLEGFDPWMSEWGNPPPVKGWYSGLNT